MLVKQAKISKKNDNNTCNFVLTSRFMTTKMVIGEDQTRMRAFLAPSI